MKVLEPRESEFDVMALGEWDEVEGDNPRFRVKPSVLYPAMVERIKEVVTSESKAIELQDRDVQSGVHPLAMHDKYLGEVKKLTQEEIDSALLPFAQVTDSRGQIIRTIVLEIARRWFTRALKNRISKDILPIITIEKDEDYRIHQEIDLPM